MKKIWAYVRWQHKINGNSLAVLLMYDFLGNRLKVMHTSVLSRLMVVFIILLILTFSFAVLTTKEIKKIEKLFPIKKAYKYGGILVYTVLTFIAGVLIAYLGTNTIAYYMILITIMIILIKNGQFSKENQANTDLRKWFRRR